MRIGRRFLLLTIKKKPASQDSPPEAGRAGNIFFSDPVRFCAERFLCHSKKGKADYDFAFLESLLFIIFLILRHGLRKLPRYL